MLAYRVANRLGDSQVFRFVRERDKAVWLMGIAFWIHPAILVPLSPRYEREIHFGLGYITVYVEGLGVALLLTYLIFLARLRWKEGPPSRSLIMAGAVLFALFVGMQFAANGYTLRQYAGWIFPRQNLDAALDHGVLTNVPRNAILFLDNSHPVNFVFTKATNWYSGYFYYMHSHRIFDVQPQSAETPFNGLCARSGARCNTKQRQVWELRSAAPTNDTGYVIVSKIDEIRPPRATDEPTAMTRDATIFERGPEMSQYPPKAPVMVAQGLPASEFYLMTHGPGWALYQFHAPCAPVLASSLVSGAALSVAFDKSVYAQEQNDGESWRWARKNASLTITNPADITQRATLSMDLGTYSPLKSSVSIRSAQFNKVVPLTAAGTAVKERIVLKAGQSLKVKFSSTAHAVVAQNDPRDMHFKIANLKIAVTDVCKH